VRSRVRAGRVPVEGDDRDAAFSRDAGAETAPERRPAQLDTMLSRTADFLRTASERGRDGLSSLMSRLRSSCWAHGGRHAARVVPAISTSARPCDPACWGTRRESHGRLTIAGAARNGVRRGSQMLDGPSGARGGRSKSRDPNRRITRCRSTETNAASRCELMVVIVDRPRSLRRWRCPSTSIT